jgi:hypothetical protein
MCQKKNLEVKLESVDPTGFIEKSKSFELEVIDDKECPKLDRLFLHVGDCLYRINEKGLILERLVPHENN